MKTERIKNLKNFFEYLLIKKKLKLTTCLLDASYVGITLALATFKLLDILLYEERTKTEFFLSAFKTKIFSSIFPIFFSFSFKNTLMKKSLILFIYFFSFLLEKKMIN